MRLSVRSLPPELLSQIFISCLPENPCFSPLFSPLLLTQVCHYWRVVALETHELWSTVMIRNHAMKRRGILSLLNLWLERSGTRPLDVFLDIYFIDDLVSTLIMQEFAKSVADVPSTYISKTSESRVPERRRTPAVRFREVGSSSSDSIQ